MIVIAPFFYLSKFRKVNFALVIKTTVCAFSTFVIRSLKVNLLYPEEVNKNFLLIICSPLFKFVFHILV